MIKRNHCIIVLICNCWAVHCSITAVWYWKLLPCRANSHLDSSHYSSSIDAKLQNVAKLNKLMQNSYWWLHEAKCHYKSTHLVIRKLCHLYGIIIVYIISILPNPCLFQECRLAWSIWMTAEISNSQHSQRTCICFKIHVSINMLDPGINSSNTSTGISSHLCSHCYISGWGLEISLGTAILISLVRVFLFSSRRPQSCAPSRREMCLHQRGKQPSREWQSIMICDLSIWAFSPYYLPMLQLLSHIPFQTGWQKVYEMFKWGSCCHHSDQWCFLQGLLPGILHP